VFDFPSIINIKHAPRSVEQFEERSKS